VVHHRRDAFSGERGYEGLGESLRRARDDQLVGLHSPPGVSYQRGNMDIPAVIN
jgi:hypothetical protein